MRFFLCWNRETVFCSVLSFCVWSNFRGRVARKTHFHFPSCFFFFLSWKNILLVSIGKRENIYPCSSSNGCAADCAVHSDRTKLNHHDVVTVGNLSLGPAHFLMGVLDSKPFFYAFLFSPSTFFQKKEKNINFVWNFSCLLFSRKGEKWWRKKHKLIV